ncbi:MAG: AAA family ATPase [Actinobacteria bacterium]|nr:AAA family ATPase [Actinomycetota bacterium]
MRVTHLSAQGLLSFGDEPFSLYLEQGGLSVVVGPNASGKSNLGTLIDLVATAVAWSSSVNPVSRTLLRQSPSSEALRSAAVHARRHHLPEGEAVEARLGIELTGNEERELVGSFMRAAIVSGIATTRSQRNLREESWVAGLPTDTFGALFRGELVVSHNGVAGSDWRVRFDPADKVADVDVTMLLNSYEAMLVRAGEELPSQRRSDLAVMLGFGAISSDTQPIQSLPEPDSVFERLVPDLKSGTSLMVTYNGSAPEQIPDAIRMFLRRASLEGNLQPNSAWGPGVVWERILRQGIRHLRAHGAALTTFDDAGLPRPQWVYSPKSLSDPAGPEVTDLPRRLWELHNGGPSTASRLQAIHKEFTSLAPGWEFAVAGSLEPSVRPTEPVPLRLAVEGGGGVLPALTHSYRSIVALPVGSGSEHLDLDMTLRVQLTARRSDGDWEPLAGAGTGIAQALVIAEALGDAAGRFVFLDEPAVNLHPRWQRHVRARLEAICALDAPSGPGQFLMVTHAAALAAPVQSVSSLPARLTHDRAASSVIGPPGDSIPCKWPKDLSLSTEGWELLFADAVILVEGDTELGAFPLWFKQISLLNDSLEWSARNIAIFSTGGDHGFESWGRYLSYYHIPWAIVCDGTILDPYQLVNSNSANKNNKIMTQDETTSVTWQKKQAWVLLQAAKARGSKQFCKKATEIYVEPDEAGTRPQRPTFDEVTRLGETQGIFTLANWFARQGKPPEPPADISPIESIDDLIKQNESLWNAANSAHDKLGGRPNKVRVGLRVANACPPPESVHDLYGKLLDWLNGGARLSRQGDQ